jgi:hypothetical protein
LRLKRNEHSIVKESKVGRDEERNLMISDKKDIIRYLAEDGNVYCVECINMGRDIMKVDIQDWQSLL